MSKRFLDKTGAPLRDAIMGRDGRVSEEWERYLARLPETLSSIPNMLNVVFLSDQGAAISSTTFQDDANLVQSAYRVNVGARISRAATTSSSLTVTIAWTDGGVAQSFNSGAITGNTTTTRYSGIRVIRCDAGSDVSYSTAYTSVGATSMQYNLDLSLERFSL